MAKENYEGETLTLHVIERVRCGQCAPGLWAGYFRIQLSCKHTERGTVVHLMMSNYGFPSKFLEKSQQVHTWPVGWLSWDVWCTSGGRGSVEGGPTSAWLPAALGGWGSPI